MTPRFTLRAAAAALACAALWPALAQAQGAAPARPMPGSMAEALTAPLTEALADPLLPSSATLAELFRRTPAWQAATLGRQAEQAGLRQASAGTQEWTVSASLQRWRQSDAGQGQPAQWQEAELGIDRPIRLPGKRALAEGAAQARVAQADAALQRAWRDFGRQVLQHWGTWQREQATARVSESLVALLQRQAQAVATRQRLGDAARIETAQAEAALAQAQAQAEAARARATQARATLDALFAGWDQGLVPAPADTAPGLPATADANANANTNITANANANANANAKTNVTASANTIATPWLDAQLSHAPELTQARREAASLRAQAAVDAAERRPDPSVGLRLGSNRGGAERMLGVVLSVPIGGTGREAAAAATALRAAAAEAQADELARQLRAEGLQRLSERDLTAAAAQRQAEAATRLARVADTLARGFALGEGSLGDVLTARRLAHEQALLAATSAVDRQQARLRLQLEAGVLWPDWGTPAATPSQRP